MPFFVVFFRKEDFYAFRNNNLNQYARKAKANWQSLLILALVGGGCILFYALTGLLLGAIDIAGARMKEFLHS